MRRIATVVCVMIAGCGTTHSRIVHSRMASRMVKITPMVRSAPVLAANTTAPLVSISWPWSCIARYESTYRWAIEDPPYSGGVQIMDSEWSEYAPIGDRSGIAADYPPGIQIAAAEKLLAAQGWGAWPVSSRLCGLR